MEDRLKNFFYFLYRRPDIKNDRHLQTDDKSPGANPFYGPGARPNMSLKARMLGGQAKTIMRLGGSMR